MLADEMVRPVIFTPVRDHSLPGQGLTIMVNSLFNELAWRTLARQLVARAGSK
jgi:hypothetical protein